MITILLCRRTLSMSRKATQSRSTQHNATTSLKDLSNRLSNLQIGTKRQQSSKPSAFSQLLESIKNGKYKRIVVLAGAGISTPSGIPDFRTPGTGLYDNLQRYKIPYPEAIFELSYFYRNPKPFFQLAKELYPGRYQPNIIHYFIRYLHDQDLLHRVYTQNIDGLERMAGIPAEKIVEAHGTFVTATCLRCREKYRCDDIRAQIFDDQVPKCYKTARCTGVIKPDIVFFGEDLPPRFQLYTQDLPAADCCIVMGTSLAVYPFAGIVDSATRATPRLLLNRELVGTFLAPRLNDVTMIGDLEMNVKDCLTRWDAIGQMMALMKQENDEHEKKNKAQQRPAIASASTAVNDRLKAAETFLEQKRKFSMLHPSRPNRTFASQPRTIFNESTKNIVEKHNDALLFNRRRSKSLFPVIPSSQLSSSTSDSLDSSLSDSELTPFSFQRTSTTTRVLPAKANAAAPNTTKKRDPLLNASLRRLL